MDDTTQPLQSPPVLKKRKMCRPTAISLYVNTQSSSMSSTAVGTPSPCLYSSDKLLGWLSESASTSILSSPTSTHSSTPDLSTLVGPKVSMSEQGTESDFSSQSFVSSAAPSRSGSTQTRTPGSENAAEGKGFRRRSTRF